VSELLTRPNGKTYRPRSDVLCVHAWENEGHDGERGVIVLGTLDPQAAWVLAQGAAEYWYGEADMFHLADPRPGWRRDRFEWGERAWAEDDERGRPSVMFTWAEKDAS
jgi:hypothetical protein